MIIKQVIVTGGTGFIGSRLILELLHCGVHVTAVVRKKERLLPEIVSNSGVTVVGKQIEELSRSDFSKDSYDFCFHLGWNGVSPKWKNDSSVQMRNIEMSMNLLEVCGQIGCKCFLAAGTVAEYAFCDDIMNINGRQTPNDLYGAAKAASYYLLEVRARQLGIPFIWSVIPSTFGEGRTDHNIITYTVKELLSGNKPKYGNLDQMWDFLYVGEVVRALMLIAKYGKRNKVYGIGSGEYRPLKKYIESIRNLINPDLEIGIGELPAMSEKVFSSCVNIYELIKDTGFRPEVSFEEGIKRTIEWIMPGIESKQSLS